MIDKNHWKCCDCGKDTSIDNRDYYMVTFELWAKYGVGSGMLCMGCMETRLGHPVRKADLLQCPLNTHINKYTMKILKTT